MKKFQRIQLLFSIVSIFFMQALLIAQPTNHIATLDVAGLDNTEALVVANGLLFIADNAGGQDVEVFNASAPFAHVATIDGGMIDDPLFLFVADGLLFVGSNRSGHEVVVFDATSPFSFSTKISKNTLVNPIDLFVAGGLLFVADDEGSDDVEVFNASSPFAHVATIDGGMIDNPRDLFVAEGLLFVADNDRGSDKVEVFNASSPFAHVATINGGMIDGPEALFVAEGLLFVADESDNDVEVFNASSPFAHVATIDGGMIDNPVDLFVVGGLLFVADDAGGDEIEVFNASSPFAHVATIDGGMIDNPEALFVDNGLLFVADDDRDSDDVEVFNASSPFAHVATINGGVIDNPKALFATEGLLFVADDEGNDEVEVFTSPTLTIAATTQANEDATDGLFTVTTSHPFATATTVNVTLSGTATNGTDYANIPATFSFPANNNMVAIAVDVSEDVLVEGNETVIVSLGVGTGYIVGAASNNSATVTITDNDFPILTIAATTQANEGGTNGEFTITTSDQFATATTVNVTLSGTATNGTDYANIASSLVFPANQTTLTVQVMILMDDLVEGNETVILTLNNIPSLTGGNYTVGTPSFATITITDDDMLDYKSGNELMFGDPCSCTDPRNCNVNGTTYFHDTLTITAGGNSGLTITAATGATNFFIAVPCFGGGLTNIPPGTPIPESPVGSGEYKIEFWRPSGIVPTLSVVESGVTTTVPANTFQPICTMEACVPIPTMSQWGLLIFTLLIMNLSIFFVRQRELI